MKMEFSKKMFLLVYVPSLIFSTVTAVATLMGLDSTNIANISLALWGVVTMGYTLYSTKAKAENLLKIGKSNSMEDIEKASAVKDLAE